MLRRLIEMRKQTKKCFKQFVFHKCLTVNIKVFNQNEINFQLGAIAFAQSCSLKSYILIYLAYLLYLGTSLIHIVLGSCSNKKHKQIFLVSS